MPTYHCHGIGSYHVIGHYHGIGNGRPTDNTGERMGQRGLSTVRRMKQLGDLKPGYTFGMRLPGKPSNGLQERLPFKKSWPAISVMAVFTAVFAAPLFTVPMSLGDNEDLFDLTTNLFTLFWLLGWSVGVLILVLVLLAFLFAGEVLIVTPEAIRLRLEIFHVGLESTFRRDYVSNLRYVGDGTMAGSTWRGKHLAFDYLDVPVGLGSDLDDTQARILCEKINAALTRPVPSRLPAPVRARLAKQQARLQAGDHEPALDPTPPGSADAPPRAGATANTSTLLLVIANAVPLAGVFLLGWRVADIMLLFWFESAIIGFFNILKMLRIGGLAGSFTSLFFIGHFGAFMAVHLMFIFALFIEGNGPAASLPEVMTTFTGLWPAILALFVSHGFSYRENFLGRREYERVTLNAQMGKPYARIVLMHVTIIVGGFLTMALQQTLLPLILLIGMKIVVDLRAHGREHRQVAAPGS